ncbi:ADP-ribosylation factor-binding protein GGA3 [Coccinella septempunctata]|uniref:ADP-ribosylation factor-binding protein GGA3 n=1 Tax=Coccinella septempunctata TaxID=41139 RepID=UPI001D090788|nr:ADP-ribosylation factor-binding protein GGA3 [Coccinella septempunctata]
MDLVTRTSLEALLLKATSSSNQNIDTAAVEAFCTLINKERDGAYIGSIVIANRLHCGVEKEVMQTLNVLDNCMSRCGTHFQSEIGKFRFLNEMIKLVSPKYLGCQTPIVVKQKVLQLLYVWTIDFPKETKIKEAYDMLRKQGVIKEIPNPNIAMGAENIPKKRVNSIFNDSEKSKLLQKLLQSKDPEDIQAANWLIKSMVKEDEKRVELKSRRAVELEAAQNNIRLLNEMLDSYIAETTSEDEMDLIKELYQSCERLQPNLAKLATETSQNDDILGDILQVNDELTQVFSKYKLIIIGGKSLGNVSSEKTADNDLSLLNFDLISNEKNCSTETCTTNSIETAKSNIDVLSDLFDTPNIPDANVLKPIQLTTERKGVSENKYKALDDLDILKEHLRKENLSSESWDSLNNSKSQDKTPMNLLLKKKDSKHHSPDLPVKETCSLNFDLSLLMNPQSMHKNKAPEEAKEKLPPANNSERCLVDVAVDQKLQIKEPASLEDTNLEKSTGMISNNLDKLKIDIKLKDIHIELKDIKPSSVAPVIVLEKNQVLVTLHHAKDRPKDDVKVFVVTTVNKNDQPLSNYLLQAVVPKNCKLKLQTPSGTDLPSLNPFLPPSAITQIMLIANPEGKELNVKFVLSYSMDDETITEMGEITNLWVD